MDSASPRRILATACLAGALWGAVPQTAAQFISHIDLAPIPRLDEDECPKLQAEPQAPNAPHTMQGLIGGATLTPDQALTNLNVLLEASVSAKAIDALKADVSLRDPGRAAALVPGALLEQRPLAALALLLQAQAAAPRDGVLGVSLAGLANHMGLHREALALLGQADRQLPAAANVAGVPVRALLLSNKGYALNATGRPKEAEAALREAIRLAPNLAEAYTNLAFALGDQDKCPQAARYLRAGKTRKPAKVLADSDKPGTDESGPERVPVSEALDLSRAKVGQLPAMPIAASPLDADDPGLKAHLKKLRDARQATAAQARLLPLGQAAQARRTRWSGQGAVGVMSADRAEWLMTLTSEYAEGSWTLMQLAGTSEQFGRRYDAVAGSAQRLDPPPHTDPELNQRVHGHARALLEMIARREAASEAFAERRGMAQRAYERENEACVRRNDNLCSASAMLRRDTAICGLAKEAAGQRMGSATAYDAAFRDLYGESSRRLRAVASYFGDAAHHEEAKERARWFAFISTAQLAGQIDAHRQAQAQGAAECKASNKRQVDLVLEHLRALEADRCQAGGRSAKASIGVVEAGANCEEVSIGASTPGHLGLFVKVSYEQSKRYEYVKAGKERFLAQREGLDPHVKLHLPDHDAAFDGKLTVYGGGQVKGELGTAGADAKAGGYVEFDCKGDVTGYGVKAEASVSGVSGTQVGVGAEQGVEIKVPMMSPSHAGDD